MGELSMPTTNERDSLKYVPITGPGVDALERRKEHNNNEPVTVEALSASIAKVKDKLFAGLRLLTQGAYERARGS
jgi:hypothetical protein